MIQARSASSKKGTIVRSNLQGEPLAPPRVGRKARLFARCPIGRRMRHRPVDAKSAGTIVPAGADSGRERLTVGILTLIAAAYGFALLARIIARYGV